MLVCMRRRLAGVAGAVQRRRRMATAASAAAAAAAEEEEEDGAGAEREGRGQVLFTASPSSLTAYRQCPYAFWRRYVQREPTPTTAAMLKGTLVHRALELFLAGKEHVEQLPPLPNEEEVEEQGQEGRDEESREKRGKRLDMEMRWMQAIQQQRRAEAAAATAAGSTERQNLDPRRLPGVLKEACAEYWEEIVEVIGRGSGQGEDEDGAIESFLLETQRLCEKYMAMEDPRTVRVAALEAVVHFPSLAEFGFDQVPLMGVIDRIEWAGEDHDDDNDGGQDRVTITDYKTGRSPVLRYSRPVNAMLADRSFFQLRVYAAMLRKLAGLTVEELRLLHLRDSTLVRKHHSHRPGDDGTPDPAQDDRETWDEIVDIVGSAIQDHERGEFTPSPNHLCDYCAYRQECPAFAHEADTADAAAAAAAAEGTSTPTRTASAPAAGLASSSSGT